MGKPAYREIERWSPNNHGRGGAKVTNFFLHTQEGDGTAESLAGYLQNPASQVSYHYTVDNSGVVCDVVDTDMCSWSVLDANPISINLCFAGSRASWTRQQWIDRMGRGIEIAAWLAVQDCKKYGFSTNVIAPPYKRGPGISDHRYVTKVLGMGSHTDVGDGFPWDVFAGHVNAITNPNSTPTPGGFLMALNDAEQRELLDHVREIRKQLGPWPQLGKNKKGQDLTLVDSVAKNIAKADI
ncbi:hypothetical protein G9444_2469 [Rhodococcus erythropolis]|uniref:N-acetylmuramoyl-L-alanine amidase domain-containing protein n=1 Tax=Rhodococcus erythropolis TaxID=1833 RepID=A0A6G9CRN9_RHOER|nr:N-acetylmuramoyl-L-alanine amidase [Rhodococcus erythropolis]QIP39713.1 hypothetical protein G9444_2469 [Rhodococcus erythropolis]